MTLPYRMLFFGSVIGYMVAHQGHQGPFWHLIYAVVCGLGVVAGWALVEVTGGRLRRWSKGRATTA